MSDKAIHTQPIQSKRYYAIGEVANILNVNASVIRFWLKTFPDYLKVKRNKNAKRVFVSDDIEKLQYIYNLTKVQGLTLKGVEKVLSKKEDNADKEMLTQTLVKVRSLLSEIRKGIA